MRERLVELNPGQFILEPDDFLWRERCRIIKRRDRHVNRLGIASLLEKQMRAAARRKRSNPTRMFNFARLAYDHAQIFAIHRSPRHNGRTGTAPAIDAMTITERKGLTFEFVSRPTAETSTGQFHIIKFFCSGGRVGRNETI
jgi:hypothetical protein